MLAMHSPKTYVEAWVNVTFNLISSSKKIDTSWQIIALRIIIHFLFAELASAN